MIPNDLICNFEEKKNMKKTLTAFALLIILVGCKKKEDDNLNSYMFQVWSDSPTDIRYYDEKGVVHNVYLAKYEWCYSFEAEKVNAYCRVNCRNGDFLGKLFKNGVVVNSFNCDKNSLYRIQYLHGQF